MKPDASSVRLNRRDVLGTRSCVCWGTFSAGIGGISGVDVRGCGEGGQRLRNSRQAFLRVIRAPRSLTPRIPDLYGWR